jgi:hypothetical protein
MRDFDGHLGSRALHALKHRALRDKASRLPRQGVALVVMLAVSGYVFANSECNDGHR